MSGRNPSTPPPRRGRPPAGKKRNPYTGTRVTPANSGPGRSGGKGGGKGGGSRKRGGKGKKPWTIGRVFKILTITGLVMVIVMALGFVFAYNMTSIPKANSAFQTQTTKIFYANGKSELGTFAEQNRETVPYNDIPQSMRDAAVAAEDRTFWTNHGIDPKGILRAAFSNAQGNATQGASTITQQYVKILYLTSERTFTRKFKEALVSLKLQRQQTKQEILAGYLNTIYFGRGAYGVQAAAQTYFRTDAKNLTVQQSAFLAAILNSPEYLDPANGKSSAAAALARYQYVINGMASMGTLSSDKAAKFAQHLPHLPPEQKTQKYAYQRGFMLQMIHDELRDKVGLTDQEINGGGLQVTSTFTASAMKAIKDGVFSQKPPGLPQLHIGAVSLDVKTGAVRGIYGGQDYLRSSFNWALAGGQPGSSFKPFALAAGLKDGFSLKDTFDGNSPYTFPDGHEVKNEGSGDGNSYGSAIDLIKATEESVNTAYMDLTESMGPQEGPAKIRAMAQALGVDVDKYQIQANSGISLGQDRVGMLDMANAYGTIANGGMEHPWYVVQKVVRDGKTIYTAPDKQTRAVGSDIASDVSYALQQVVSSGTGTAALGLGRPAAGKTGTATNDKDQVSSAWFIGYTPQIVSAVMYVRGDGNDQLDGWLPSYFGGSYPARTWTAIMQAEMNGLPEVPFPEPAFVDGTAPSSGHDPYTPPPPPPKKPRHTPRSTPSTSAPSTPTKTPTQKPTKTPTTTPTCGEVGQPPCGGGGGTGGGGSGGNGTGGQNRVDPARRE